MATIAVFSVLLLASLAVGRPHAPSSTQVPRDCSLPTGTLQETNVLAKEVTNTSSDLFLAYCENHQDVQIFLHGRSCAQYLPADSESHASLPPCKSITGQFEELYRRAGNYSCTLRTARCLYTTAECVREGQTCDTASATVLPQDNLTYCSTVGPLYEQAYQTLYSLIIKMRALPELEGIPQGSCPPLDWADTEDRVHDILTSLYEAAHLGPLITHTLEEAYCTA